MRNSKIEIFRDMKKDDKKYMKAYVGDILLIEVCGSKRERLARLCYSPIPNTSDLIVLGEDVVFRVEADINKIKVNDILTDTCDCGVKVQVLGICDVSIYINKVKMYEGEE